MNKSIFHRSGNSAAKANIPNIGKEIQKALSLHSAGNVDAAGRIYEKILAVMPNHPDALHLSGLVYHRKGLHEKAAQQIEAANRQIPNPIFCSNLGAVYQAQGRFDEAIASYKKSLEMKPDHIEAAMGLGNAYKHLGQYADALSVYKNVIHAKADAHEAYFQMGLVLEAMGKQEEAQACYENTLRLRPDYAGALKRMKSGFPESAPVSSTFEAKTAFPADMPRPIPPSGSSAESEFQQAVRCHQTGQLQKAREIYQKILQGNPRHADALHLSGIIAHQMGRANEAFDFIQKAIAVKPDCANFHCNLGLVWQALGKADQALAAFQQALALQPEFPEAHNNMGNLFHSLGKSAQALSCYQKAVEQKPDYAAAHHHTGLALQALGKYEEAIAAYQKALSFNPNLAEAHYSMGSVYLALEKDEDAFACFQQTLAIAPEHDKAFGLVIHLLQQFCEWEELGKMGPILDAMTRSSLEKGTYTGEQALMNITRHADPAYNFAVARAQSAHIQKRVAGLKTSFPLAQRRKAKNRITVGYLSADFRNHPVAHLISGMFRLHDRNAFEICCYSYGKDDKSSYRSRIVRDSDRFADIRHLNEAQAAAKIYEDQVDILVDLTGHTRDERLGICALRPAPVQVTWLGFPGTTGADFMDYIICDSIVIPESHRGYYSEKRICMPHCYMIADDRHPVSARQWQKADIGVKEESFVFCSLNNAYKMEPVLFDVWMNILRKIPDSVLWLRRIGKRGEANLKIEAENRGISAERIVFADKIPPKADYLSRLRLADLALDTRIYNGHATTVDALWAGVPVVTLQGTHFASRAASSILTAAELPELITRSLEEYEHLVLELARHPEKLRHIKEKLASGRVSAPLFDTASFVQNLEKAFVRIWQKWLAGEKPGEIDLSADAGISASERPAPDTAAMLRTAVELHQKGQISRAEDLYKKILSLSPNHPDALHLLGFAAYQTGRNDAAIALIKKAAELCPKNHLYLSNLGLAYKLGNRFEEAVSCYEKAISLKPDDPELCFRMANVLRVKDRIRDALEFYQKALRLKPDYPDACNNMGNIFRDMGRWDEAVACYRMALQYCPGYAEIRDNLLRTLQMGCYWQEMEKVGAEFDALTRASVEKGEKIAELPLTNITRHADLQLNFAVAGSKAREIAEKAAKYQLCFSFANRKKAGDKIVIGYLSNDFRDHPVGHLICGLFRHHDRSRFQVHCYSYGKDDGSEYRKSIERNSDRFADIRNLNDAEAAKQIYQDRVDILVDLMGHTRDERMGICALRPAPLQMTWLGFPGTSGAEFMDYILTDQIVTPESHAPYYSEKFIYMPHCYMISDNTQEISAKKWSKNDLELDEKAFLFCSFNNPNKIDPVIFDVWMRILHSVPHSFLWLRKMGKSGERNLRTEAQKRGIHPSRLLFAKRVPAKAEYLSRLGTADLALDTRIYNGHATTVDALWAGVPVVTLQGTHFASRAASSILTAAGMPELITENLQDYQNLAVRLASDPAELKRIRAKLAQNRIHAPLFDTAAFVRNLEAACQEIWHLHISGEKPRQMEVRKSAFFQEPAVNSAQIAGNGESAENVSGSFASEKNKKQDLVLPEVREKLETAVRFHQQGQWQKAEELYRKILEICPDHPDALHLLGLAAHQTGRNEESLVLIQKAVKLCPENPLYLSNLGLVLKLQNRTDEAISCYEKALQIKADADIYYRLGNALRVKQQNKEAVSAYQKALELQPAHTDAANNLGNLHKEMGEYDSALAWYHKALEHKPGSAGIYNNIGGVHKLRGEPDLAAISYRKCLEISPDNAEAYNNLGVLYQDQARHEAAAECYRKALAVRPEYAKAHSNLGSIFLFQEKYEKAVLAYAQAIKLDPEECLSHIHMGLAYKGMKKEDEALVCFRRALECKPDDIRSNVHYTDQLQHLCLWADLEKRKQDLRGKIEKALENGEEISESPFGNLTRYPDPGLNLKIARHRAREISKSVSFCKEKFSFAHRAHFRKKIRVGYLSDDFWNHPVSHLIVSLFALHDREKFEVFCYSSGQDDGSFYRKKIEKDCDCFTDIRGRHFADSARLICEHQIDILVDLMGHTKNSLLNVCALRPAPVQVTWLGFPGTTGADFMDYILTDRIVSPEEHTPFYSEKLLYLPNCYMMTDNQQEISDRKWKKSDLGMKEDCFVFCSLNNSYKLEPVMFDLWMNLLKKIPNSVLWLRSMGESGIRNIRNEAYAGGVARERIVFTDRVPSKADYLSRLKLADLALDTRIYNGHATTVDALWSGVPVITLQGTHFASRAASSILTAAGLSELIVRSMEEYETLAFRLASHPDELGNMRQKLWENRLKSPLFDTKGFVRNLEKVYEKIQTEFFVQ